MLMLAMVSSIPTLAEYTPGTGSVDDEQGTLYTLCCCYHMMPIDLHMAVTGAAPERNQIVYPRFDSFSEQGAHKLRVNVGAGSLIQVVSQVSTHHVTQTNIATMAQEKLEFEVDQAEAGPTIALSPEKEEQFARITRNLQEVTSGDIIRQVLSDGIVPRAYWGSATTGRPHIAYCVPLLKIADFLTAGVAVKILLAGKPRRSSYVVKTS